MNKPTYNTKSLKPSEVEKKWFVVDASDQPVGRFASRVARIIRGKHKPSFTPHINCGDGVIVLNANDVKLTGEKWRQKHYVYYSGYPGGKKEVLAEDQRKKDATKIIEEAVKGMLPNNKLGNRIFKQNLHVYPNDEHPHQAQNPEKLKFNNL